MAQRFSNEEKFDILVSYIKNQRNANRAANHYLEHFPERHQPGKTYFRKLVMNLLEFGSFEKSRPRKYSKDNENRNRNIQEYFTENPTCSTRTASNNLNIPKSTIHDVLKQKHFHPYKPTIVQGLQEGDFERRRIFCNWYQGKYRDNPNFNNNVLWTDETRFTNCGVFNKHNHHYWSTENPQLREERRLQVRFGFNVWCGMYGNRLIGPFIYDHMLTGQRYLAMLQNEIVPAIRNVVPDNEFNELWFQQDGCPAHNSRIVQIFLAETFGNRIISNSGPVRWPARSPDLTPLDFYLWGYVKNEVYEFDPPESREVLEQRTRDILTSINRNTIHRVTRNVIKKCQQCIENNGRHFET